MRLLRYMCACIMTFYIFIPTGQASIGVSAENAILMDQNTGEILFEKNIHEKQSIASITKIMTAIIAIESFQMDEMVTSSRHAIHTEGSSIYLEEGERMLMEDLVYGLMLRSGNDAAIAIAEHIGGSEEGFTYLMNEKASWLGMTNTNFTNPHGLENDDHYSTAYDMAILMQYAMNDPLFRKISGTTMHTAKTRTYGWKNKNKLLTHLYKPSTGGKTGFTKKAGRTLLSTATHGGDELIVVTLNAPDDWNDHISLYTKGFQELKIRPNTIEKSLVHGQSDDQHESFWSYMKGILKRILRVDSYG
ncbi:MAG TPA: D-alanyl-D-alanine carboxypeptidase family protein [Bacillota bacterium]|nr:D-alanyl-D-alanine carboxypeptidase family protein [Bacillota bacterium]